MTVARSLIPSNTRLSQCDTESSPLARCLHGNVVNQMLTVLFVVGLLDGRKVVAIPVSTHKATGQKLMLNTVVSARRECLMEKPGVASWPVQNAIQNVEEDIVLGSELVW